jgi:excisionase family DNA binding protein
MTRFRAVMIQNSEAAANDRASDGLLRKPELARKLSISKRTLDAWMKRGLVPFLKLGGKSVRFRLRDVLAKLDQYRIN